MKTRRMILTGILLLCVITIFMPADVSSEERLKLIIDTDMGFDDCSAILYLLNRPDVEIIAITVTGAGEVHCQSGIRNVFSLIALANQNPQSFRVACGDEEPRDGYHSFPGEWRDSADHFFGEDTLETYPVSSKHAAELIIDIIKNSKSPVTILALGPLTNIADALEQAPTITANIKRLYIMGGAVEVEGNLKIPGVTDYIENTVAEWNIYIDPVAAKLVFHTGIPIYLIPLDATNKVKVTQSRANAFNELAKTPETQFIKRQFERENYLIKAGQYYMWDTLSAIATADHEICGYKSYPLDVIVEYGKKERKVKGQKFSLLAKNGKPRRAFDAIVSGQTKKSMDGVPIFVCQKVDVKTLWEKYIQVLNKQYVHSK